EETALAVVLPGKGTGAARVLQRPDGSLPSTPAADKPLALSMDALEYDDRGRIALSGRATPGATIQIYAGNQPLATATADAAGEWSATSIRARYSGCQNPECLARNGAPNLKILPVAPAKAAVHSLPLARTGVTADRLWFGSSKAWMAGTSAAKTNLFGRFPSLVRPQNFPRTALRFRGNDDDLLKLGDSFPGQTLRFAITGCRPGAVSPRVAGAPTRQISPAVRAT